MGKGQRKRTERRAEEEPAVRTPTSTGGDNDAEDDDPGTFDAWSDFLFESSAEHLSTALEFGDHALDTVADDRVLSAAHMQYAQLQAQIAQVEATRDLSLSVKRLQRLAGDIEHQLRFRQDPLPGHSHTLHLG